MGFINEILQNKIWDAFTTYFREIKGYEDWTDEQIDGSFCDDDIIEFIYYIMQNYCTRDFNYNIEYLIKEHKRKTGK